MTGLLIKSKYQRGALLQETVLAFVYRGTVLGSGHSVLIFAYKPEFLSVEKARALFDISKKLIGIHHPNVLPVLDYDYDGRHFYVMYDARNVWCGYAEYLAQGFPDHAAVMDMITQVISGLCAIESAGLVAGNVSINTLYVSNQTTIQIANIMIDATLLTPVLPRLEALDDCVFMAPEFLVESILSTKSDVYSLGILMYFLLTHHWPYPNTPNLLDTKRTVLSSALPEFLLLAPKIPDYMIALIQACLVKDPVNRIQKMADVAHYFQSQLAPTVTTDKVSDFFTRAMVSDIDRQDRQRYRHTMKRIVIVAVAALVCFALWLPYHRYVIAIPDVAVPNVVGMNLEQAQDVLTRHHLKSDVTAELVDLKMPVGAVIEIKPPAGRKVKQNRTVHLMISKGAGTIQAPSLTGKSLVEAVQIADELGATVNVVSYQASDTLGKDQVLSQTPVPGSMIEANRPIQLVLSSGPDENADSAIPTKNSL